MKWEREFEDWRVKDLHARNLREGEWHNIRQQEKEEAVRRAAEKRREKEKKLKDEKDKKRREKKGKDRKKDKDKGKDSAPALMIADAPSGQGSQALVPRRPPPAGTTIVLDDSDESVKSVSPGPQQKEDKGKRRKDREKRRSRSRRKRSRSKRKSSSSSRSRGKPRAPAKPVALIGGAIAGAADFVSGGGALAGFPPGHCAMSPMGLFQRSVAPEGGGTSI